MKRRQRTNSQFNSGTKHIYARPHSSFVPSLAPLPLLSHPLCHSSFLMCLGFIFPPLYGKDKSGLRQIIITTRVYFCHLPISYCWLTEGMDIQMVSLMSLPWIMALHHDFKHKKTGSSMAMSLLANGSYLSNCHNSSPQHICIF